ncbi:hypothetical protein PYW08_008631 [Mythimna loreyi]|uniref:Uncharacterized protein n=1 Tax=Mythimna loreyi TaxID=667449 RepID=A0ACC2Q984_9NEOP|nr:hypothetical protein PYW08_008631 [Mythimna loreyi]
MHSIHKDMLQFLTRIEDENMAAEAGPAQAGLAPPEAETGPDGEIIGGPRTPQQIAAQRRLQQTQAQVDEMMIIMGVIGIVIIGLLFVRYRNTSPIAAAAPVAATNGTVTANTNHCKY